MFLETVRASFIVQGHSMAKQINGENEKQFLEAAKNWALNGGGPDEPKPAEAVEAQFDFEGMWRMTLEPTGLPVSTLDPKTLLPTYGTDENAIGGPVGGPIPGQPGRFYAASNATPWLGQTVTIAGKRYVYTAITPFNRAWEVL
jgi:hypothetical protein